MIKCENLTKQDIHKFAVWVADSFLNEEGSFKSLKREDAINMFDIMLDTLYKTGNLYSPSENYEGFCAYWTKSNRPSMLVQIKMAIKMLFKLSFSANILLLKNQIEWTAIEDRYKKADNFVEVFLLCVRKEYQGEGFFRSMLNEPFTLAESLNTICVLDTDSDVKAQKYMHVGMHIIERREQKSGTVMLAMEK